MESEFVVIRSLVMRKSNIDCIRVDKKGLKMSFHTAQNDYCLIYDAMSVLLEDYEKIVKNLNAIDLVK